MFAGDGILRTRERFLGGAAMFEFLWDLVEQDQKSGQQMHVPTGPNVVAQAEAKVITLEQRYERLRLTNMGMWELMKRRMGVTDQDLAAEVQGLVAEAGVKGRNVRGARLTTCPSCHRNVLSSAMTCVYCGTKLSVTSGFGGT
jgi:hypothetical protein